MKKSLIATLSVLVIIIVGMIFLFVFKDNSDQSVLLPPDQALQNSTQKCIEYPILNYYLSLRQGTIDACSDYFEGDESLFVTCQDSYRIINAIKKNDLSQCSGFADPDEGGFLELLCPIVISLDIGLCDRANPFDEDGADAALCGALVEYLSNEDGEIEGLSDSDAYSLFYRMKALRLNDISFCDFIASNENIEISQGKFNRQLLCKLAVSSDVEIPYQQQVENPCI